MPCYSVQTSTVAWSEKTSFDLLFKALQEMKLSPRRAGQYIYFRGGNYEQASHNLTLEGSTAATEKQNKAIKVAYAAEVTKSAFINAGFQIKSAEQVQQGVMMRRG